MKVNVKKFTVFVVLVLGVGVLVLPYLKKFQLNFKHQSYIDSMQDTMPPLAEDYTLILVDKVWVKVPVRWYKIYPYKKLDHQDNIEAPLFAERLTMSYKLKELSGIDSKLAHSNISVSLKGGVESDLNYFFYNNNERWSVTANPNLGLKSYKKKSNVKSVVYYLPIEEVKTLKGYSFYYWCQTTDKGEPYVCVGQFEVVKGLVVEYRINVGFMKHWKTIHNGVVKKITAMVTKT